MGIPERKEREREQRKAVIIECAMRVFLSKGIAHAKMEEIAECAELSRATLYTYFKNKEELVLHVMSNVMSTFIEYLEEKMSQVDSVEEKIGMIGEAYLEFYRNCHGHYLLLNSQDSTADLEFSHLEFYDEILQISNKLWFTICKPIDDAITGGYFRKGTNAIEIATTLWAASNGMLNIMDHVVTTHDGKDVQKCMEKDDYLRQMSYLNFEQMLRNLWNAIIESYQSK